jgi:chemotaxis signal transduction protein
MQSFKETLRDEQSTQLFLRERISVSSNQKRVELLLVVSGNQPFAILMTQVHNVVRPGPDGIEVLHEPNSDEPYASGEIYYQGEGLKVLELPRALQLPLVEPINRSRILVCGKLKPDGTLENPFGVAIEDVIAVKTYSLDDLRLLPKWLTDGIPGLIWGAVLVEREVLVHEKTLDSGVLEPVNFGDFSSSNSFENGQTFKDSQRPVMLLDLEVLRSVLFVGQENTW